MQDNISLDEIINNLEDEIIKNEERKKKKNIFLYAILKTIMIVSYTISGTLLIACSIKMNLNSVIYGIPLFIVGVLAIITGIATSITSFMFLSE